MQALSMVACISQHFISFFKVDTTSKSHVVAAPTLCVFALHPGSSFQCPSSPRRVHFHFNFCCAAHSAHACILGRLSNGPSARILHTGLSSSTPGFAAGSAQHCALSSSSGAPSRKASHRPSSSAHLSRLRKAPGIHSSCSSSPA